MSLLIATVNVNGLRAAVRKGMHRWLDDCRPDVMTMQEVRASDADVDIAGMLGDGWHIVHAESPVRGRAGVAVASRHPIRRSSAGKGIRSFAGTGRWIEADIAAPGDAASDDSLGLTVISTYVHTGDTDVPERMAEKHAFFRAMTRRMEALRAEGRHVVVTGDLNVAHHEVDIKNWKGNVGKAGFHPDERAHLDRWARLGWVDLGRHLGGDGPGPYTWWSYRGRAYDNDAGWRIDYQIATPELASTAKECWVDRSVAYADRWSDHAPLVVRYAP